MLLLNFLPNHLCHLQRHQLQLLPSLPSPRITPPIPPSVIPSRGSPSPADEFLKQVTETASEALAKKQKTISNFVTKLGSSTAELERFTKEVKEEKKAQERKELEAKKDEILEKNVLAQRTRLHELRCANKLTTKN